jgi:hypothetical protein
MMIKYAMERRIVCKQSCLCGKSIVDIKTPHNSRLQVTLDKVMIPWDNFAYYFSRQYTSHFLNPILIDILSQNHGTEKKDWI